MGGFAQKRKNIVSYIIVFFLILGVLTVIAFLLNLYPFGDKSLVVWDANVQYIDFLAYFRRMLLGKASWKYTFSKTFGGDMASFTGYYLNSPFNLLVLFFENWEMPKAFQLIYFLKLACSALACQYYFNSRKGRTDWPALIFSVTYGLAAYQFVYGYNIMWLDAVILLPFLAAGIEKMIKTGKGYGLYLAALMAGLYTCYYMGYALCLFSVLYFLILWVVYGGREKKKLFLRFAMTTMAAAALLAFFLLPVFFSLSGGPDRPGLESLWMGANFNRGELFRQMTSSFFATDQIPTPGRPPLYGGIVMIWLIPLFFLNWRISWREKLIYGFMAAVLLVSMWSRSLNMIWQGLKEPNGCNYRYAFLFSFICLVAARQSLAGIADMLRMIPDMGKIMVCLKTIAVLVLLSVQMVSLGQYGQNVWKLLIDDAGFDLAGYEQRTIEMNPVAEKVSGWCEEGYRMELNHYTRRSYNDSMQYGYAGLSHYSSTEKTQIEAFENTIGLSSWLEAEMPDVFTDSLMGVRYRISLSEEPKGYPLIETDGRLHIYENPDALPLVFAVTDTNRQVWETILERREWGEDWPDYEKPSVFRKKQDAQIRCEVELSESGRVLTTIPYDTGWQVRVDGKKTVTSAWLDTFLAFDVAPGVHTISLKYQVKGLLTGTILSVLTAAAGVLLWRRKSLLRSVSG